MQPNPLQHLMPTCSGARSAAGAPATAQPGPEAPSDVLAATVRLNEIFHSIQGESTWAGLPCTFVRLTGCPLRCTYCDTEYAFREGKTATLGEILAAIEETGCRLVELTGGEPLSQRRAYDLVRVLCDRGFTVLIETSGAVDIAPCDPRSIRILDIKTPGSGEAARNRWSNLADLRPRDEVKLVLADRADYEWAVRTAEDRGLFARLREGTLAAVLFSPAFRQPRGREIMGCEGLDPAELAAWILRDRLPVRLQLQIHKKIWGPAVRGV